MGGGWGRYLAVVCPRCGRASAARRAGRHQCPYCGFLIDLSRARVIASGDYKAVREAVVKYNEGLR
nr:MAG: hypothetical protein TU35_08365 [Thermoproteus sp. AZ2]